MVLGEPHADGTLSWRTGLPVVADDNQTTRGFSESSPVELRDGRLALQLERFSMTLQTKRNQPEPLYDSSQADPAYHLRYTWLGWPARCAFERTPTELLDDTRSLWEKDGLRLLEYRWTPERIQLLFSTKASVSPVLVACRAKGRLDHAIRSNGAQMPLSRKFAVRSVGNNIRREVETYIEGQVGKARFVDHRFREFMEAFTVVNDRVDLAKPTAASRGRYWYNLHVVLLTAERYRMVDPRCLAAVRDWSQRIAEKKSYGISRLSVMPDHLHLALRGDPAHSPEQIAGAFQNNLAHALGRGRIWRDTFYVGTFSEYNMAAIRRQATSP